MTREDTIKILSVLRGAYPAFYRDITKQEALIPLILEITDEVVVTIPSWMLEHRNPIYDKNY